MTIDENELIAYHLGELSALRKRAVQAALEKDATLAAESEEIAETLRAFSGGPVPVVDAALVERMWQGVRPSLAVLEPRKKEARWRWMFGFASGVAACAVVMLLLFVHRVPRQQEAVAQDGAAPAQSETAAAQHNESPMIQELHDRGAAKTVRYNGKPGPLTMVPVEDKGFAGHLDAAERLLTQVNHEEGPLPAETRGEVHRLLLQNAVYQQRAQVKGDYATANVMDDLGRVLVTLDAAPPQSAEAADAFRLEMNVGDVLFDLRILHHNKLQER